MNTEVEHFHGVVLGVKPTDEQKVIYAKFGSSKVVYGTDDARQAACILALHEAHQGREVKVFVPRVQMDTTLETFRQIGKRLFDRFREGESNGVPKASTAQAVRHMREVFEKVDIVLTNEKHDGSWVAYGYEPSEVPMWMRTNG